MLALVPDAELALAAPAAEMLSLGAEQMQLVMSEALCASTFPWNSRLNGWLEDLLPGAADQPNLERFLNVRIPIPGWGSNIFPILCELGVSLASACIMDLRGLTAL